MPSFEQVTGVSYLRGLGLLTRGISFRGTYFFTEHEIGLASEIGGCSKSVVTAFSHASSCKFKTGSTSDSLALQPVPEGWLWLTSGSVALMQVPKDYVPLAHRH